MFFWLLTSFLFGLLIFIVFLCIIYVFLLKPLSLIEKPNELEPSTQNNQAILITSLLTSLINEDRSSKGTGGTIAALNMITNFLFQELKDTSRVNNYVIRKMSEEFKELMAKGLVNSVIEKMIAKDFYLGSSCPIIKSFKLNEFLIDHQTNIIKSFDILCDIEYYDGFSITIDIISRHLGIKGCLYLKVKKLIGKAQIKFIREPYNYWFFAFVEEPQVDFGLSANCLGATLTPYLFGIITNQLRKSIRRKHTLPNFKVRYKPFFDKQTKPSENSWSFNDDLKKKLNEITIHGSILNIIPKQIEKLTDVHLISNNFHSDTSHLYLTISLDKYSLEELLDKKFAKNEFPLYEIELSLVNYNAITNENIFGLKLVEIYFLNQNELVVQKIGKPIVEKNMIKQYDILFAINNQRVNSIKNALKIIKALNVSNIKLQFQRPCIRVTKKLNKETDDTKSIQSETSKAEDKKIPNNCIDNNKVEILDVLSANISEHNTNHFVSNARQLLSKNLSSIRRVTSRNSLQSSNNNNKLSTSTNTQLNHEIIPTVNYDLASASQLLDYYNAACQDDDSFIDLVNTSAYEIQSKFEEDPLRKNFFKKSKKTNLNSLVEYNKFDFDELFQFELNEDTKYVNFALWSENAVNRINKNKHVLLGYYSISVEEVLFKVWYTMKGQSKGEYYFKSLQSKATASTRPHDLNSHPGHDNGLLNGCLSIEFECILKKDLNNDKNETAEQELVQKIAETIVQSTTVTNTITSKHSEKHVFLDHYIDESHVCSLCNKRLKGKCLKCGKCRLIIHKNCYKESLVCVIDKKNEKQEEAQKLSETSSIASHDDITSDRIKVNNNNSTRISPLNVLDIETSTSNINKTSTEASPILSHRHVPQINEPSKREKVKNFFSGLKARKWNSLRERTNPNRTSLNNFNAETSSLSESRIITEEQEEKQNKSDSFEHIEYDDKQDSLATNLYDDLPVHERRVKLEEMITKYRENIEMMSQIKEDMEKELVESQDDNKKIQTILHDIKDIDEKIRSVVLLHMQFQLSLANCEEIYSQSSNNNDSDTLTDEPKKQ